MTTIATRIPVLLLAADPILRNGLRTTLHSRPEIRVIDEDDSSPDTVVIVATDRIDDYTKQTLRSLQCRRIAKVVLIAGELDDADVLAAVENGVCAVARRSEVDADILVRLATAAMSGEGVLPPDLLGRLLGGSRASSGRCSSRGACTSPGSPIARPRCCGCSPRACPPARSRVSSRTRSARSRASSMT